MYTLLFSFEHSARVLARWHWPPLWDPFAVLGRPFAADLVTGMLYPLNWFLRLLPEAHSVNVSIALHHCIAAFGLFALLRFHQIGLTAAVLGAVAFGFGGLLVSLDNLMNGLQSATWLPWVILAFEIWCERRSAIAVAGMAVALAMTILGGMPEVLFFADALAVALAVDRAGSVGGPSVLHSLTALLVANLLALSLCTIEVVPFVELIMHSSRLTGLRAAGVIDYSLHPLGVLAFLIPRRYVDAGGHFDATAALWEGTLSDAPLALTLYLGVTIALLIPALGRLSRFQRWWWSGIGLAFLALALGKYLPGYLWLVQHVTPLRMVRYPEKFLLVVHGLLAVGGAVGLEQAMREPTRFRTVALSAALLAGAALVAQHAVIDTALPALTLAHDLRDLALWFGLFAVLAVGARTHPRAGSLALVLLAAVDLYRVNGELLPTVPWEMVQRTPRTLEAMPRGDDPLRIYTDGLGRPPVAAFPDSFVQEQNLLLTHSSAFYSIGNLNAAAAINLSDHEALEALIESVPRERLAAVFASFNVRYITSAKELHYPGLRMVQRPRTALEAYVFEVEPHTPRAYVPARLHAVTTPEQAIEYLRQGADPSAEVAVEAESMPPGLVASIEGTARIASYLPERVEVVAQLHSAGLVVLADTYYPGWQASVDGTPAAIVRANYFVRGVYVDAGEHHIVLRYAPLSYRVGAAVSGLVGGALLLSVAWSETRRRRRSHPPRT
jgi:hypothetical protein